MKKHKITAMILAATLSLSLLASCGGGGGTTKPAGDEEVTIRVTLWDYSNLAYYKTIFDAFKVANPKVKVDVVEFAADEYDNTIVTQLAGKQDFDVVFTKATPALSSLIEQGHILALNDLIDNDTAFDKGKYLGLIDQLALNDKTYGVPFRKDNNLIYYNKTLFDQAGVAYPEDGMTMEEYHALAAKMTTGEGNDKVYGAHVHTWPGNVYNFARRVEAFNFTDPSTYKNLIPYYEEVLAMQEEGVIQDYGSLSASKIHYSGVMYNQQAAMLQIGTWFTNMLAENVTDFDWGVCSLPSVDGAGNENAVGGVTPVSIGGYGKYNDQAWEFIKYACGEEGAAVLAGAGIVPGYSSDKINAIFDDLPNTKPNAPEGLSKYLDLEKYVVEQHMHAKGKAIDTIINEQHSAIMTKSVSVEEGVQGMFDRVTELLNG